jgi:hypothetical protein
MMQIPRVQLFEFEDFSWFPTTLRNLMTDFLRHSTIKMRLHLPIVDLLQGAMRDARTSKVVDLCSGGGGLLVEIQKELCARGARPESVTFTDKYPNVSALADICAHDPGGLAFEREPIDATAVPRELDGIRTMFSAFHHFSPDAACKILSNAVERQRGIAIFEVSRRSLLGLVPMLLSPLGTWVMTPGIRPLNLWRFIFTYLVPAVPFFIMWDGIVSALRTYTVEEMRDMAASIGAETFDWRAGEAKAPYGYRVTYLIGTPHTVET